MIKSKYINDILDLLLDSDNEGFFARKQITFLTDSFYDYTASGLFVSFDHDKGVNIFKTEKQNLILDGVKIETVEYQIEANATLFFTDGIINNLEIWCYCGQYPKNDLTKYTLTQIWTDSENKTITK